MKIKTWHIIVFSFVALAFIDQCSNHGKTKIVEKTVIETVTDTITKTVIKEVPKEVIVNKYIDKEGEKVIVYVDKPNDSSFVANKYETTLTSNNATAKLDITTTGELLDVQGLITYPKETKTIETFKTVNNSGLFIYGSMPVNGNISPEIGAMYQIKNKILIGAGVQFNNFTKKADATITLGIKL